MRWVFRYLIRRLIVIGVVTGLGVFCGLHMSWPFVFRMLGRTVGVLLVLGLIRGVFRMVSVVVLWIVGLGSKLRRKVVKDDNV